MMFDVTLLCQYTLNLKKKFGCQRRDKTTQITKPDDLVQMLLGHKSNFEPSSQVPPTTTHTPTATMPRRRGRPKNKKSSAAASVSASSSPSTTAAAESDADTSTGAPRGTSKGSSPDDAGEGSSGEAEVVSQEVRLPEMSVTKEKHHNVLNFQIPIESPLLSTNAIDVALGLTTGTASTPVVAAAPLAARQAQPSACDSDPAWVVQLQTIITIPSSRSGQMITLVRRASQAARAAGAVQAAVRLERLAGVARRSSRRRGGGGGASAGGMHPAHIKSQALAIVQQWRREAQLRQEWDAATVPVESRGVWVCGSPRARLCLWC